MDKKATALIIICLIALFSSFIFALINPIETTIGNYPLILLVLIFFFFGAISFGFLSFVPHIILGLAMGTKKNVIIFIYITPIIIATYAGLKLGSILMDDFNKKKYFLENGKNIIALIAIAIIMAITIETILPLIIEIQLWPDDMLGMNLERPENINEALEAVKNDLLGR